MRPWRVPAGLVLVSSAVAALAVGSFAAGWWLGRGGAPPDAAALEARLEALELRLHAALNPPRPSPRRAEAPAPEPAAVLAKLEIEGAPALGPEDAAVTVVEFADFQCPFCARVRGTLERLRSEYPEQVRVVFKHFPLEIHPESMLAHRAAAAAAAQGRFWELHDRIFAAPGALDRAGLLHHARALGLDLEAFERALDGPESEAAVRRDMAEGAALGVQGTPAFFINGRSLSGAQPYEAFRAQVELVLAEAPSLALAETGR